VEHHPAYTLAWDLSYSKRMLAEFILDNANAISEARELGDHVSEDGGSAVDRNKVWARKVSLGW
jgi:hypothetical protein